MRVVEGLNAALHDLLAGDPGAYLLGEDVADPYGGAFRATRGLSTRFPDRVLSTPTESALSGTIGARATAFGVRHVLVTSLDVPAIRAQLAPLPTDGPLVVEFRTHRLGPHSKGDDTREPAAVAALPDWAQRCAAEDPERFRRLDAAARVRVERVVADVLARPLSDWRP